MRKDASFIPNQLLRRRTSLWCSRCADSTNVQRLGNAGLDGTREYRMPVKPQIPLYICVSSLLSILTFPWYVEVPHGSAARPRLRQDPVPHLLQVTNRGL